MQTTSFVIINNYLNNEGGETMDQNLVEKITKLVLSKLEESSEFRPLTSEELSDWNSLNLFSASSQKATANACQSHITPLSEAELTAWKEISFSINKGKTTSINAEERVRFHHYH